MKSVVLARDLDPQALEKIRAFSEEYGALTPSLLRRAVRDAAILGDLSRRPGQYAAIGATWGVSEDTVRDVEDFSKRISRTM